MLIFRPAVLRGSTRLDLPRPVLVCRLHDSWDYLKLKVPLRAGEQVSGPSQDGVRISLEGQIGSQAGALKLREEEMLEALLALRGVLHVEGSDFYVLSLYEEEGGSRARYFRQCVTDRFDVDLSNQRLYSYAISIRATDPVLYDGPLG